MSDNEMNHEDPMVTAAIGNMDEEYTKNIPQFANEPSVLDAIKEEILPIIKKVSISDIYGEVLKLATVPYGETIKPIIRIGSKLNILDKLIEMNYSYFKQTGDSQIMLTDINPGLPQNVVEHACKFLEDLQNVIDNGLLIKTDEEINGKDIYSLMKLEKSLISCIFAISGFVKVFDGYETLGTDPEILELLDEYHTNMVRFIHFTDKRRKEAMKQFQNNSFNQAPVQTDDGCDCDGSCGDDCTCDEQ